MATCPWLWRRCGLEKPFNPDRMTELAKKATQARRMTLDNRALRKELSDGATIIKKLIGLSPAMERLREDILDIGQADTHVLIDGETGTGKTLVAQRRPFRAPHHTSSAVALVGGGAIPRPGEVSLAHHGVLFLDELPEFSRRTLEVLREPLETGHITIARAAATLGFPAHFQLVATMNPCPCGYAGDLLTPCVCGPEQIRQYRARLSGPLLDRIDLQTEVPRERDWLRPRVARPGETSATVRARVAAAQSLQIERQRKLNSRLNVRELALHAPLHEQAQDFLADAFEHFRLTARSYHRLVKLARTIADLAGRARIEQEDLAEALNLRRIDTARGSA